MTEYSTSEKQVESTVLWTVIPSRTASRNRTDWGRKKKGKGGKKGERRKGLKIHWWERVEAKITEGGH